MRTKNVINLLLAGALTVGFAACNNDDVPNEKAGVTAVQFRVSEAQTRALTDGQNEADGVGAETMVKDGLFLTLGADQTLTTKTLVPFSPAGGTQEKVWTSNVVKYTGAVDNQTATLILNAPASAMKDVTKAGQTISIDNLAELTSEDGFTMTGTTTEDENNITIEKGIKPDQVGEGKKNFFPFTVERVVSKVQFSMPGENVVLGGELIGLKPAQFTDIRYAVAGSADKVYLFKDKAGERKLDVSTQKYTGLESAIHANPAGNEHRTGVTKVSDKKLVAHFGGVSADETTWTNLNSLTLAKGENYDTKSQTAGVFFLENSLNKEVNGKGQLNYNDITYVKVYAAFKPKVRKYDAATDSWSEDQDPTTNVNEYYVRVKDEYHTAHPEGGSYEYKSGGSDGNWELKITDKPGTFYRGANGELYYDLISARKANNPKSMKFSSGKMVWMTPANNQIEGSGATAYTKYADTRRNNIYSLSLTSISGYGKNYDPIDPDDPNLDNPGNNPNPDEPTVDTIIPIDPEETNIQVKATILRWNLVYRGVDLK